MVKTGKSPAVVKGEEGLPSFPVAIWGAERVEGEVLVSTGEVFCGGGDDLAAMAALPEGKRPELVLVVTDGTERQQPHLEAFTCPKVLVVGDLQRGQSPLRTLLRYATEEPFDLIVLSRGRQHADFFAEAGFPEVHWIPGWGLTLPPTATREEACDPSGVVCVGQVDEFHAYRRYLLQSLERAGVAVECVSAGPSEAAAVHARCLVNVNCSAGGELNPRVFAVLASGGFLLTERLSPEAGLETLFHDGEHLVCYDGVEDLQQKVDHYRQRPEEALRIARAGHAEYLAHHRPARKRAQLLELVAALGDQRRPPRGPLPADLEARLAIYEQLQELHRAKVAPAVLFAAGVDPRLVADAAHLPRLRLLIERGVGVEAVHEALRARGVAEGRVSVPGEGEVEGGLLAFDALVAPPDAVSAGRLDGLIAHTDAVVLEGDPGAETLPVLDRRLRSLGFERSRASQPTSYQLSDEVAIGERHFAAGEPEEAAKHFQAALAADPESVRALNNLGVVSYLFGEKTACLQFLDSALSLDRRDPETLLNLAETKLQLGDEAEARRLYGFVARRVLDSPVLAARRETLRAELELPAALPKQPAAFEMPVPPSLRRLRIAAALDLEGSRRLVAALIRLADKGLDFRCTLTGMVEEPSLQRRVRDAGLEPRVELGDVPDDEDLQDLFARCNVLVAPPSSGPLSRRASAAGLVVVTETDEAALATALDALCKDRARWRNLSRGGDQGQAAQTA